jgi:glycerol-3-phosphate O-acyltransferase/dihydroxyacetone phosphate acyltransferase
MMLDPVILCMHLTCPRFWGVTLVFINGVLAVGFPFQRMMNYWSKGFCETVFIYLILTNVCFFLASLFANPIASWVLYSSGNIPVDRKSKDRLKLLKGTIEALAQGKAVALFPEGTSYTEPRIMQVKDGAAWAAMEYTKWAKENPERVLRKKLWSCLFRLFTLTNQSTGAL